MIKPILSPIILTPELPVSYQINITVDNAHHLTLELRIHPGKRVRCSESCYGRNNEMFHDHHQRGKLSMHPSSLLSALSGMVLTIIAVLDKLTQNYQEAEIL